MKVTVCQINNNPEVLETDWEILKPLVKQEESELVLLPEMPFSEWVAGRPEYTLGVTSEQAPCITQEINLLTAKQAKMTYPRYVPD